MHLDDYHNTPVGPPNNRHEVPGSTPHHGVCPTCGRVSGFFHVGVQNWHFCDPCKTAWHSGSERSGNHGTEEDWKANREKLKGYTIVQPTPTTITKMITEWLIGTGKMERR